MGNELPTLLGFTRENNAPSISAIYHHPYYCSTVICCRISNGHIKRRWVRGRKRQSKITEKDLSAYSSSATVLKLSDGRYQFTIVANLQKTSSIAAKVDKRVDIYRIIWESPTTGVLLNSNNEFKDDKSSFTISNDQLIIKSWVARNQLWETQYYSLVK